MLWVFSPLSDLVPKHIFSEDHQMPEGLFRMIVGGRYAGTPEENEEKFLLGTCEIGPESLGRFKTKRLFAEGVEFPDKALLDLGRCLPGDLAGFEPLSHFAEPCE
jgi:hypothetical protein